MRGVGFDRLPPPPRPVPPALRLALWLGGWRQLGCLLVALGAPFAWLVTPHFDWSGLLFVGRPVVRTLAMVSSAETTGLREGRAERRHIYRVRFRFAAASGRGLEGVSWGTQALQPGQTTTIEFPDGHPELARVVGMRGAPLDSLAALVPILYAFPLAAAVAGSARLKRQSRLLARGQYVLGRLVYPRSWAAPGGSTHWLPEPVADLPGGSPLPLLFDPARPADAEPVTRFSWLVAIGPDGRLVPPRAGVVLWLLVLPGLAVLSTLASAPLAGVLR
jgi:hypothetical protein